MRKSLQRNLVAIVLAVLWIAAAAVPAAAQAAADTAPRQAYLQLSVEDVPDIGNVIAGLDVQKTAIPSQTLLGLLREATTENAFFADADTGQQVPDGTPAGTGLLAVWTDEDGAEHSAPMLVPGDLTGSGVINLTQLTTMAGALQGNVELTPLRLAAACLSGGSALQLTDLVNEAAAYTDGPDISAEQAKEITDEAAAIQTGGGTYGGDVYYVVELHKGDVIFGMLPGQSAFYTDLTTVEMCQGSYIEMYRRLQMLPHVEYGYREQLGVYEVQEDMYVASGFCLANSEINGTYAGPGGGLQYVVPDFEDDLKLIETRDLHA